MSWCLCWMQPARCKHGIRCHKMARSIDEIIRKAMEEGAFDNLPGKHRPLDLADNPHVDPEWQMAYHLLRENGFAPHFIEMRQSIEQELAHGREMLARSWAWRERSLAGGEDAAWVEARWNNAQKAFQELVTTLNKRIQTYNLEIPVPNFHRRKIDLAEELRTLEQMKH